MSAAALLEEEAETALSSSCCANVTAADLSALLALLLAQLGLQALQPQARTAQR